MGVRPTRQLVREREFAAEGDVGLIEAGVDWAPYLSLDDAYRLDDVRQALRSGDLSGVARLAGRVCRITPVSA